MQEERRRRRKRRTNWPALLLCVLVLAALVWGITTVVRKLGNYGSRSIRTSQADALDPQPDAQPEEPADPYADVAKNSYDPNGFYKEDGFLRYADGTLMSEVGVDIRKSLFFTLAEKKWPLVGMEALGMSLEDIFINIVDQTSQKSRYERRDTRSRRAQQHSKTSIEAEIAQSMLKKNAAEKKLSGFTITT